MHFMSLNLHRGGAVCATAQGNFSGIKNAHEVIIARGNILELLRVEADSKIVSIAQQPAFCVIRSLTAFRLAGGPRDYCAVGSDAGKLTILEFNKEAGEMSVVHCETFGKTGCRRIVPGQFLCADPQGRAIMIAAVEKQKLVYIVNRDASSRLTIGSPLEAHKAQAVTFDVCALDVNFENPVFASIEIEYGDADQDPTGEEAQNAEKHLVYYQMDLGLNHVSRVWSAPICRTASLLLQVPGGHLGPSGVLVCGENWVAYRHQDHPEVRTAFPRRKGTPASRDILITSGTVHRTKEQFFFLVQTELGDLYQVRLELDPTKKAVTDVIVYVLDTVPLATSLSITKRGALFLAAESSNHMLFSIRSLGEEQASAVAHRCDDDDVGDDAEAVVAYAAKVEEEGGDKAEFEPSSTLLHLVQTDEVESLAPITHMLAGDLANEGTPQMYCLCGQGPRSTLRILRHGLAVTEVAVSDLPGRPSAVWSIPETPITATTPNPMTKYIVVSFTNATLVLSVGESVEEVADSGFLASAPTLECTLLANGSMLQIHANGLRVLAPGRPPQEWRTPGRKTIEKACANERQAIISLAGGEIVYFKLDESSSMLQEVGTKNLGVEVSCLAIGEVPEGRVYAPFLAVGDWSGVVRVLSLAPESLLTQLTMLNLGNSPESLCLVEMAGDTGESRGGGMGAGTQLYLYAGLSHGVMQRVAVDATAGTLSDSRQRLLGTKPVKLFRLKANNCVLALSSRSWLSYAHRGRHLTTPLSYEALEYAASFSTEHCPDGIVAISDTFLRIVAVEQHGEAFNQQSVPLSYTPRQIAKLPGNPIRLVVVEADADEYNKKDREELEKKLAAGDSTVTADGPTPAGTKAPAVDGVDAMAVDEDETGENGVNPPPPPPEVNGAAENGVGDENADDEDDEDEGPSPMPVRGPLPPKEGTWASCVRLVDPAQGTTLECLELGSNEAALSVCPVVFHSRGGEHFVAVGAARGLCFHPRSHSGCAVHIYRVLDNRLQLLHTTDVPDVPLAMCEFQGQLLVGAGKSLRLYDLGKRRLLLKCEHKGLPNFVTALGVKDDRVMAADMTESIHFLKYRRLGAQNQLTIFADDQIPRMMSRMCVLDYDTAAGADKFGNFFVLRVPSDVSDDIDNPSGNRMLWNSGLLNGAPNKLDQLAQYHLGEIITSISKASLVPAGAEVLLYSTIMGGVGAFVPLDSKEVDFFTHLEMFMRQEKPTLCGREHTSYRSYYLPVKACIDGDLCEQYGALSYDLQKKIATGLDRSVGEVAKKLEDLRNRLL